MNKFDNKYYWKIEKACYSVSKIINDIKRGGFKIEKTYRIFEHPYHKFFILKKIKDDMVEIKNKPTVSVILPTYNRAHLIDRAIRSVLNQTYQDFELIVVDDCSTDNTKEVVKSFKDERITYIKHEKNKGAAAARNTGIKAAKGEYIAFQDSDDDWFPEKLKKQMKVFEMAQSEVGIVYTGFWRIEGNKKTYIPSYRVSQKEGNIHKQLLKGNFVTTQSVVIRKKYFEKLGMFDENLPRLQDWELFIRVSKYYKFKCIDEPLLNSYHTLDSISTDDEARVKALEIILAKHFEDFNRDKKLLSKHYFSVGILLCLNNEIKKGKDYLIKAAKLLVQRYIMGSRLYRKVEIRVSGKLKKIKRR